MTKKTIQQERPCLPGELLYILTENTSQASEKILRALQKEFYVLLVSPITQEGIVRLAKEHHTQILRGIIDERNGKIYLGSGIVDHTTMLDYILNTAGKTSQGNFQLEGMGRDFITIKIDLENKTVEATDTYFRMNRLIKSRPNSLDDRVLAGSIKNTVKALENNRELRSLFPDFRISDSQSILYCR